MKILSCIFAKFKMEIRTFKNRIPDIGIPFHFLPLQIAFRCKIAFLEKYRTQWCFPPALVFSPKFWNIEIILTFLAALHGLLADNVICGTVN